MKIERIGASPDRAGRYAVSLSDGSTLRLYRQTAEDFGIFAGKDLSDEEYRRLLTAERKMSAKMRAVRIISAANVSRKDLENRLIRKGEAPDSAREAVEWLEDMSVLDDSRTAEQLVTSCAAKGYGISRARQMLYEKRIPKELWEAALADYPDMEEAILKYLRGKVKDLQDSKEIKRAVDALLRRGHSYSSIRSALRKLDAEPEDLSEESEWRV